VRQVFAFSGMLRAETDSHTNFDLTSYALTLTSKERGQRLCYIPTAVGDSTQAVEVTARRFSECRSDVTFSVLLLFPQPNVPDIRTHLLEQDVLLVEGGSVVNLLAVWRAHNLPAILRECWEAGVVCAGASAGSLCWHIGGPTDSFRDALDPFGDGLGFLPYSNGVHDDFAGQPRRSTYRSMVASGLLPAGYATEDGVGLHYIDTALHEAVTARDGARAWWVEGEGQDAYAEMPVPARLL
jgi:peptidase E